MDLYINGKRADLDEQGLILYNYTATDLDKPSAVKNSYTKQVTLPGTPVNDGIFSHAYRLDRLVGASSFNPLVRTPFKIFSDTGEVLQSGYLKLDKVEREGASHTYIVTLYGGVGELLYGLTYGEDGEKLTLADLTYGVPDSSFVITINKDNVYAAWEHLYEANSAPLYDIINFAPCYNGLPDKFDSDKARIQGDMANQITLSRKFNEWEVRDLRSYLQRPAIRTKAIWDAIVTAAAARGKTLTLDATFFDEDNKYYENTWMLLPMLTAFQDDKGGNVGTPSSVTSQVWNELQEEIPMGGTVHLTGDTFSTDAEGNIDFSAFPPSCFLRGSVVLAPMFWSEIGGTPTVMSGYLNYFSGGQWHGTLIGAQVVVYVDDTAVAYSRPTVWGQWNTIDWRYQALENILDFREGHDARGNLLTGDTTESALYVANAAIASSDNVRIDVSIAVVSDDESMGGDAFRLYESEGGGSYVEGTISAKASGGSFQLVKPSAITSGITVDKGMLLSSTGTPADFILSYCRMFGLKIVETAPDHIAILDRTTFFNGAVKDLTGMVDSAKTSIVPLTFTKKWQKFTLPMVEAQVAKDYKTAYGKDYGSLNLDTGLEFNADTEDLQSGTIFKGGVSGRDTSAAFYDMFDASDNWINPALSFGYTDASGTAVTPSVATRTPINANYSGYDLSVKPFGYTKDQNTQKAVDLAGMLVMYQKAIYHPGRYFLSDNYGTDTPCWQIATANDVRTKKVDYLPVFSRQLIQEISEPYDVLFSLDFGTPMEIYDPGVVINPSSSIYTQFWQKYLTDLYDKSNKVLTAKVHFYDLKINGNLFRHFYYYDGALWVLNKISNASLTTYDAADCEFIQVRAQDNYTNH